MVALLVINGVYGLIQPAVDNWGHAGGLIGGVALAAWLTPRFRPVTNSEGYRVGWRLEPSPATSWAIIPWSWEYLPSLSFTFPADSAPPATALT